MSDFTPITTQEQFDAAIKDRLDRAKAKYEGYTSPQDLEKIKAGYDKQIADMTAAADATAKKYANYDKELADRDTKIKGFETASIKTRVAHEVGLKYEAIQFLQGEDEKSITESAKALKSLTDSTQKKTAPISTADPSGSSRDAAYKSVLSSLTKGE